MVLLIITLLLILLALASMRPRRSSLHEFELRRRLDAKQEGALMEWRRSDLQTEVMTVRRVAVAFALVLSSTLFIVEYGWLWGLMAAFILTLFYNRIAGFGIIHNPSQRLYDKYEDKFLRFVERWQPKIRFLSGTADVQVERSIASREEFEYTFNELSGLLTSSERKMFSGVMHFEGKLVKNHMTPRSVMEAVGAHELLGPLVLDNLYKTGHTHFPVFEGDIDHLVGILHIYSLFTLDNKKSLAVKDAMEPRVFYINEEQTLDDALTACIKHRRHLLVVVNSYRETVGVITIEDVVEQLIGRKIVDQFAEHDDLRKVAERNPRHNNLPKRGVDV